MTGFYAALTVAPLIAEDLTGARTWSGLPGAAVILGTACGTVLLSELMRHRGRRPGLSVGWMAGAAGAGAATAAVARGTFPLFVVALLVIGLGHGATQLARFAAADAHPVHRKGRVLSLVVWGGTIGAVAGPAVLDPAARLARSMGLDDLSGGLLVAGVTFLTAGALCAWLMRPDPGPVTTDEQAAALDPSPGPRDPTAPHVGTGARSMDRTTVVAVAALVTAQFVMLLLMTSTPVYVRGHDHGLAGVGLVISLHVFGMFGLAPVAGWACDRFGPLRAALTGLLLAALSGVGAAVAPPADLVGVSLALFGLGLGWSAAFVASSSLLARTDVRLQGRADGLGWAFAAVASLLSGLLLSALGYTLLALIGAALALVMAVVVLWAVRTSPDVAVQID